MIVSSIFVLAVVLAGGYCVGKLQSYAGQTVLEYGEDCLHKEKVDEFWEQKGEKYEDSSLSGVTLYSSRGYQMIENRSLGRKTSAVVIEVSGNMNPIFPNRLRRGSLVNGYDERGCVISEKLAEEMFSSHDVVGKTVEYGEQRYVIRGIVDVDSCVFMVPGKKDTWYSHIWICHRGESASAAVQQLGEILPKQPQVKSEGDLYVGAAHVLMMIPVFLLFFSGIGCLSRLYKRKVKRGWIRELCGIILGFAVVLGMYVMISRGFYVTDDYLPPSWADFSFWGKLWTEKAGNVRDLVQSGMEYRDRMMLGLLAGSGICSAAEGICVLYIGRAVRRAYRK